MRLRGALLLFLCGSALGQSVEEAEVPGMTPTEPPRATWTVTPSLMQRICRDSRAQLSAVLNASLAERRVCLSKRLLNLKFNFSSNGFAHGVLNDFGQV